MKNRLPTSAPSGRPRLLAFRDWFAYAAVPPSRRNHVRSLRALLRQRTSSWQGRRAVPAAAQCQDVLLRAGVVDEDDLKQSFLGFPSQSSVTRDRIGTAVACGLVIGDDVLLLQFVDGALPLGA